MAQLVRFVAAPRAVVNTAIGDSVGWRALGNRMLEHAKSRCPESTGDSGAPGPHLKDTLVAQFVGGPDPRVLIGSATKGDVLTYLTEGTQDHWVAPNNGTVLAWTSGGQAFFSKGHMVSGIAANPWLMDAIREVAQMK